MPRRSTGHNTNQMIDRIKVNRILAILLVAVPALCLGNDVDKVMKDNCGTHPVIVYLRDYKGILMDPQFLTEVEECAQVSGNAEILKWDLGNAEVQGCLTKKYGHQKEYVESIAASYDDAKENVGSQIEPYNTCANNVRLCGKSTCIEDPPSPQRRPVSYPFSEKNDHCEENRKFSIPVKADSQEGWKIDVTSITPNVKASSKSSFSGIRHATSSGFKIEGQVINSGECIGPIKDGRGHVWGEITFTEYRLKPR